LYHTSKECSVFQASITTTAIDLALQILIDQGLNLTCKGCDTTYNDTNVALYLSKSTLKDLDAAANALITYFSILTNFAMSTDSNDTTLFGVSFRPNLFINIILYRLFPESQNLLISVLNNYSSRQWKLP